MSSSSTPLISLRDIHLTYQGPSPVKALRGVSLDIFPGELVVIEGPSGGGKSSLLNIIGLLQTASHGKCLVAGVDTSVLSDRERTRLRSSTFSFVFQSFHTLAGRPARDSVTVALEYSGVPTVDAISRAEEALSAVHLDAAAGQDASTLSGGQQQRVAMARALATRTPALLADEPTGNLDSENTQHILDRLCALRDQGLAVVVATHEPAVAERADRRLRIQDGRVISAGSRRRLTTLVQAPIHGSAVVSKPRGRRFVQIWHDASASVWARKSRTSALVAAVSIAVGLAVGTMGLGTTARAQVGAAFDAHENRRVTVERDTPDLGYDLATTGWSPASRTGKLETLQSIAGVEFAAILGEADPRDVAVNPAEEPEPAAVLTGAGDVASATESAVRWARGAERVSGRQVLVGTHAAALLELGPIDSLATIWIDGLPYPVVGIIDASARMPQLTGSIVVLNDDSPPDLPVLREQTFLTVVPGAAAQVAEQAAIVVDPVHPELLRVSAPRDPRSIRDQIESSVAISLVVLSLVALAASMLALANAMALAVSSRRSEFGLRRALGASPTDLFALVMTEASLVGIVGGVLGLAIGYVAIFGVTIAHRWTPVVEPVLVPAALAGGVIVGALAGIAAANRASRVDPALALRM